jgi:hypothetical protein
MTKFNSAKKKLWNSDRTNIQDPYYQMWSGVENSLKTDAIPYQSDFEATVLFASDTIKDPMNYESIYHDLGDENPFVYQRIYFRIAPIDLHTGLDEAVPLPPTFEAAWKANNSNEPNAKDFIKPRKTKFKDTEAADRVYLAGASNCIYSQTAESAGNGGWSPKPGDRIVVRFADPFALADPRFIRVIETGENNVPTTGIPFVMSAFNNMNNPISGPYTTVKTCIDANPDLKPPTTAQFSISLQEILAFPEINRPGSSKYGGHSAAVRQNNARIILNSFESRGYPLGIALAGLANARAESDLSHTVGGDKGPKYGMPPGEAGSVGLFQLYHSGRGHGFTTAQRQDPELNTKLIIDDVDENGCAIIERYNAGATVGELTFLFARDIERPASKGVGREKYAVRMYGSSIAALPANSIDYAAAGSGESLTGQAAVDAQAEAEMEEILRQTDEQVDSNTGESVSYPGDSDYESEYLGEDESSNSYG